MNYKTHSQYLVIILTIGFLGFLLGCKSSATISKGNSTSQDPSDVSSNNVVSVSSENTKSAPNSSTEIIFEGSNNLIDFVHKNSSYFNESKDVIIIKGDNTIIRLININVLDLSTGQRDTLVFVGDNEKYVIDINNAIFLGNKKVKYDTIQLKSRVFDKSKYADDFLEDDAKIRIGYFDSLVTAKYAFTYFSERLATGEPMYFYELAEMYLYGIGVEQSTEKAIDLYEYAAVKDHVRSLIKLGDIFTGRFEVKRSKEKAAYYYKRCALLGEQYCDEQLMILLSK
jgi:hypothetical protein